MRVFVLSTGRCGSTTFAKACAHLSNYSAGHETRAGALGESRFDYPDQHVESDNRLSWHLGGLAARFDPQQTMYVHLTRDPERVARSFLRRWDSGYAASIIRAFGHGVLKSRKWSEEDRLDVCRFYVQTVNENIAAFLATQRQVMRMDLADAAQGFPGFLERIGAEGDLASAVGEWSSVHNASK